METRSYTVKPLVIQWSKKQLTDLSFEIIGCAIEVHKHFGPGLLASVYHQCLLDEMLNSGLHVRSKVRLPVNYKGKDLGVVLEIDLLVEEAIVVELKSVESIHPVYVAQPIPYLKWCDKPKGLLINFHAPALKDAVTSNSLNNTHCFRISNFYYRNLYECCSVNLYVSLSPWLYLHESSGRNFEC